MVSATRLPRLRRKGRRPGGAVLGAAAAGACRRRPPKRLFLVELFKLSTSKCLRGVCQKRPRVLAHRLAAELGVPDYLPVGVACQVAVDDVQLLPQIDHLPKIAFGDSLDAGGRLKLIQKVWFALGPNPYTASAIFMA